MIFFSVEIPVSASTTLPLLICLKCLTECSTPKITVIHHVWCSWIFPKHLTKLFIPASFLKLQQLGVSGSFFNLMESYLLGRSQFVQISNAKSDILHTNCGVPQGSILGPLLFQVHVNDISKNIKSSISLFADDTVLPYSSKCPYNLHRIFSSDLKTSQSWADL